MSYFNPAHYDNNNSDPGVIVCTSPHSMNIRPGPGTTTGNPLFRIPYRAEAEIIQVASSEDPYDSFKWIYIDYQNYLGDRGWLREDFTRLKGNFEQFGLAFHDMYPNPAQQSWWSRGFNINASFNPVLHYGWDQGGEIGMPISGGPKGGKVIKVLMKLDGVG